jgi:Putative beta-barrel porin 2
MKLKRSCPLWLLALTTTPVWVGPASVACGQEVNPVVDGQVNAGPVLEAVEPRDDERRGGLELGVVVAAAYDTNIYLSSTDPTSDMVYKIGPLIAYTQGDSKEGEGGYIRVAYQPTGVIYADQKANNRIDQSAGLEAGWKGKISKLTYKADVRKSGDATADTGTQTERVEFENEIRAAWLVREKVSLEAAAGGWRTRYQNPSLVDSGQYYGEVAVRYAYSPKTEVGAFYQAGRLKIKGAESQTIQQVSGSLSWQPREKISVKIDAGAELRKADGSSTTNPVVNARVDWTPREGTRFFVTAYQRQEVSALNEGQIYEVKGFTAGVSQRLGGNWAASLDGGYEVASYIPDTSTGALSREDKIWFVRPALNYQFSDQLDGSVFYEASDNDSTDTNFGYDAAVTGVELNYKF